MQEPNRPARAAGSKSASEAQRDQAGGEEETEPVGQFLLHPSTFTLATYDAMKAKVCLKAMDDVGEQVARLMVERTNLSAADFRQRFYKQDVYFGAKQALEWGLIDKIVELSRVDGVI